MIDMTSGEIMLFKAVLLQAAQDAFLVRSPTSGQSRLNRESALCFLSGGEDLSIVCDFAGVDEDGILRITQNANLTKNEKYRKIRELVRGLRN